MNIRVKPCPYRVIAINGSIFDTTTEGLALALAKRQHAQKVYYRTENGYVLCHHLVDQLSDFFAGRG